MRISCAPPEANAPLIVDPNAVLPRSITLELLQPIPGRYAKVFEPHRSVHLGQLP